MFSFLQPSTKPSANTSVLTPPPAPKANFFEAIGSTVTSLFTSPTTLATATATSTTKPISAPATMSATHDHTTTPTTPVDTAHQPSEGLGTTFAPLFNVGHSVVDVVNLIPSPFNTAGHLLSEVHDSAANLLASVPQVLTIGHLPVISTVGEAATTIVEGATTMTKIVLDHFVMNAGEVTNLVTTPITGVLNMAQDVLSHPCGCTLQELICNDTPEIDSVVDIVKQINNYEFNSIKAHLTHDILLLKTPIDTIHKALTESAQDLGIAAITNPLLDTVRNTWDSILEDGIGSLVVNPVLNGWKAASEALFGPLSTTGAPAHDYHSNLSTATPTATDKVLNDTFGSTLDTLFGNNGSTAGTGNMHTYHNTTNPTFADNFFNHLAAALPVL